MTRLIAVLVLSALAGCSMFSNPAPQARAPAPPPAQTEAQAATRDSTASREQIMAVQGRLARAGYYSGPIDGTWGVQTADALSRWQARRNLSVTGKLDQPTLDSFNPASELAPIRTP